MDPPPRTRAPSISETNRDKADNAAQGVEDPRVRQAQGINDQHTQEYHVHAGDDQARRQATPVQQC